MNSHPRIGALLALVGPLAMALAPAACERRADTTATSGGAGTNSPATKSSQGAQTKTPMDQSNSAESIRITADVRRAIMDDTAMSTSAKNCKIITDEGGVVTLRGQVENQAEKSAIEAKATGIAGVARVINELEVK